MLSVPEIPKNFFRDDVPVRDVDAVAIDALHKLAGRSKRAILDSVVEAIRKTNTSISIEYVGGNHRQIKWREMPLLRFTEPTITISGGTATLIMEVSTLGQ